MVRTGFLSLTFIILFSSCIAEKGNTSPITAGFGDGNGNAAAVEKYYENFRKNSNAAEITNLTSTFPVFNNKTVDKEVNNLKMHLTNYLYAVESFNKHGKQRSLRAVQDSYKKLQFYRKKLTADQDEVMNRYLVRIKTNLSILEAEFAENGFD